MSTYKCETVIKKVECCDANAMYQVDKDRVIVGGHSSLYSEHREICDWEENNGGYTNRGSLLFKAER